jgi:hypothetical protein
MATLKGNSIPAFSGSSSPHPQSRGHLDHTYVTSDDNYGPWGCFGRSSGGHPVSSGQGNSACADCLSKPSNLLATPPIYAGLRYGVTGVCHQAANRILRPAGISVAGVQGYGASLFLYGQYGRGGWPEWMQCVNLSSGPVGSPPQGVPSVVSSSKNAQLFKRIEEIYAAHPEALNPTEQEDLEIGKREMLALFSTQLGDEYDRKRVNQVTDLHRRLQEARLYLGRELESRRISKEHFLRVFNELMTLTFERCQEILGKRDFERLFGGSVDQVRHLVEPSIFLGISSR